MAKTKTREITITESKGSFVLFKKPKSKKGKYDFEGLSALRKLLSNERAKIIHVIKTKSPKSIYELSKMLERDFKSVSSDIHLLERFGFVELVAEKTKKRVRHKPEIAVDNIIINVKI
ncbi:MAG: hypothetical protein D6707_04715 [Bacteroidetes bacterium]|nr:MAG: hypothetical protein D6707_04715 [Bacteroidota bacterium]